jgi:hypothetical protein
MAKKSKEGIFYDIDFNILNSTNHSFHLVIPAHAGISLNRLCDIIFRFSNWHFSIGIGIKLLAKSHKVVDKIHLPNSFHYRGVMPLEECEMDQDFKFKVGKTLTIEGILKIIFIKHFKS